MWISSRYEFDRRRKSLSSFKLATLAAMLLVIVCVCTAVIYNLQKEPLLPRTIDKQVDFIIYYPPKDWRVDKSKVEYDKKAKVLTMTAKKFSTTLTITQQPTPTQFNDIPQYYPTLLDKLQRYENVGTSNGIAYLTKPKELNGRTEVVLNNDGTLLFAFPIGEMSTSDWRQFFNDARVIK